MKTRILTVGLYVMTGILLAGCGGSSSSTPTSSGVIPKVTINWPDLTRNFAASKFAKSAEITITPSETGGQPAVWGVDRPAALTAASLTYSGTDVKVTGPVNIRVRFLSNTGSSGTILGTAMISGRISSDGTLSDSQGNPLGTVSPAGDVTSIEVVSTPPANFFGIMSHVGQVNEIFITGRTTDSGFVALDSNLIRGRLTSSILSGSGLFSMSGTSLTGLAEGRGTVEVALDGMKASTEVVVLPKIVQSRLIDVQASVIAYDPSRNSFWAAFGASGPNANSLASINPATGSVSNAYLLGDTGSAVAVSSDGLNAFVGLRNTGTVKRVALASGVVSAAINIALEGPGYVSSIDVNPTNSDEAAVTVLGTSSSTNYGPIIVRGDVTLPDYVGGPFSQISRLKYLNGTTLVGASGQTSEFPAANCTISSTGCTITSSASNVLESFGLDHLVTKGNAVITSNGSAFDAQSFGRLASLDFPDLLGGVSTRAKAVAVDGTNNLVWLLYEGQSGTIRVRSVNTNTWAFTDAVTLQNIQAVRRIYRFGATGLAIHTEQAIHILDTAPGL